MSSAVKYRCLLFSASVRSSSAISWYPIAEALISAVSPCCRNRSRIKRLEQARLAPSHVLTESLMSVLHPFPRRYSTISVCPFSAAAMSAVFPAMNCRSISAPQASDWSTLSKSFFSVASHKPSTTRGSRYMSTGHVRGLAIIYLQEHLPTSSHHSIGLYFGTTFGL